ncbi:hypothetical protein V6N13_148270 [Hibiscus sabdariffa]
MGETVNIKGALSARLSWGVPRCCEGVHGCCGISSKVEVLKVNFDGSTKGKSNPTGCDKVGDFVIGGD